MRWAGVTAVGACAFLAPGRAASQKAPAAAATMKGEGFQACTGRVVGSLGLTGWDCRGDCTITLDERREETKAWTFSVEPRITGVEAGGPAHGKLEAGDVLVAIDGLLITTAEGGSYFANLPSDADVKVRYRRGGRVAEAVVHTASVCGNAWDVPPPPPPPAPGDVPRVVTPRVRITGVAPAPTPAEPPHRTGVAAVPPVPPLAPSAPLPPRPLLGIGFTCTECGTRADSASGKEVWFFSRPPEVTSVDAGGAADRAGIQIGDRVVAVGGAGITTDAGGRAFGAIRPGVAVRLTVAKRNGREQTVTLVPEARETRAPTPPVPGPEPAAAPVPAQTPKVVTPAAPAAPSGHPEPPVGLPLRYSGTLAGVEVEVRGEPVMVSSDAQGTRTMVIWTDGLWIRIRVPTAGGR